VQSLQYFTYPKEFDGLEKIIKSLSKEGFYEDEQFFIELYIGDARKYVRALDVAFDIVYQDAFSPSVNPLLWTKEYFSDIKKLLKPDGVITTYSMALKSRLALYENGLNIYINSGENYRDATIASCVELHNFKKVDMPHKISCNPHVKPLCDSTC